MPRMLIALTGSDQPVGGAVRRELERHDLELAPIALDADAGAITLPAEVTHVVHAASLSQPGRSAAAYTAVNVHGTTALLDACRQRQLEQVILISTTEAYGRDLPPWPVTESWVPRPLDAAQHSRVAAERVARTYRRRVPLAILRPAPIIMDGDSPLMTVIRHVISRPRGALVSGGQAPLSILAAADLGRAVWAMLTHPDEAVDHVFHVASTHTSWGELAMEACRLRGVEGRFWNAPYPFARALNALRLSAWVLPEPDGVDAYVEMTGRPHLIDDSRARVSLGYAPLLGLRGALAQALDIYGANPLSNDIPMP